MNNPYMSNFNEITDAFNSNERDKLANTIDTVLKKCKNKVVITEKDALESIHKVRESSTIQNVSKSKNIGDYVKLTKNEATDTMAMPPYSELNTEDVAEIKESAKLKKKNKALSDIEKWLNISIFENGKYHNMDKKTVISLAKYMFDLGYIFKETGKFNLK